MKNLILLDNPLVRTDVTILRDKATMEHFFRLALKRISYALAIEISKTFRTEEYEVDTPLEKTNGYRISHPVVLVPVLRAGLSMISAFLEMLPEAKVGHIGLQRDESTLKPVDYYYKTPQNLDVAKVILLDPMLATGGSASAAFDHLKERGAKDLVMANLITAPEGVNKLARDHPDVNIYTAALDRELNENGYIVPGLGDAGDRNYGTLKV
ncbi:MAG: uracil phosphoribosyltransferase [Bacteroidetes bacterium]|nr:uracil phosphoribosyltransferase [Bacteroidota bacterium]